MADGSERPIAEVNPGDRVVGRGGRINRVDGIHIVPLGPRMLHGINQFAPFFTAEHPFLTPGGWSALDRVATRLEMPGLAVAELTAGDVLVTASANLGEIAGQLALAPAVTFGYRILHRLSRDTGAPGQVVYNLSLNGNHSYVANGFVVHNKGGGGGQGGGDGGNGGGNGGDQGGGNGGGHGGGRGGENGVSSPGDVAGVNSVESATLETVALDDTAKTAEQPPATEESTVASQTDASTTTPASGTNPPATTETATGVTGEFSGSAAPAGPDLSVSEEQEMISRGWQ